MRPEYSKGKKVLQSDPKLRFMRFQAEIDTAILACTKAGSFVGGEWVRNFELALSEFLGARHVVSCNSCTDALYLCLRALGVGEGDDVIIPSLTAAGTAVATVRAGASPRFCDVNRISRNIDLSTIKAAMTPRVRAIIVVHLHGIPVDMDPILEFARQYSISVIEDCAQAIGATYGGKPVGTLGAASAFSFYPTKNLGCMGDGGAMVTNDDEMANVARSICNYGWGENRLCIRDGINSRLDAIQAAILSALLPYLKTGNEERVMAAKNYDTALARTNIVTPPSNPGAVYHQYSIETENRQTFRNHLSSKNIGTAIHYQNGLHEEPFFYQHLDDQTDFSNTEYLTRRFVSLPIQPELMLEQKQVISVIKEFLEHE